MPSAADDIARTTFRCCRAERDRFSNPGSDIFQCESHWHYFVERRRGRSRLRGIYRQSGSDCLLARKTAFQNAKDRFPKRRPENSQARIDEREEVSILGANASDRSKG